MTLFLDRDGTLIKHRTGHVRRVDDIAFLPGVLTALRRLGEAGFPIVITSNQSSVSRGMLSTEGVIALHRHVLGGIRAAGGRVDISFLCPHQPADGCACRKPRLAMYERAARELDRPLSAAVVVGDAVCDVEAGRAMGARPALVRTGLGETTLAGLAAAGALDGCEVFDSFAALADQLLTAA